MRPPTRRRASAKATPGGSLGVGLVTLACLGGCGGAERAPEEAGQPPATPAASATPEVPPRAAPEEPTPPPRACPADMILVDEPAYCTEVRRTCLDDHYDRSNHITICHRFEEKPPTCVGETRRMRFCIDEFEFPNRAGARSPVMVDWHDARARCEELGKRLCFESEWVAACEGPEHKPFPYGFVRSKEACNIDNPYRHPSLEKMYETDRAIADRELTRLDQGVPSGSKPGCVSDYGVRDQPGNVDEWVALDRPRGKGKWAGLKGGAWGRVRNACRPVTTSHAAEFTYYFVSFRCCADAAPPDGGAPPWKPPTLPAPKKTPANASQGFVPPAK